MKKLLLVAALFVAVLSCSKSDTATSHTFGGAGGTTSPIIPASWTVANWYINPSTGSDSNDCITSGTPCKTWHEINDHRWGCQGNPINCPRLQQNTTITFQASQPNDLDPIYFYPALEQGAYASIQGTLACATGGSLSNVTSGGAATRSALELAQVSGGTNPATAAGAFLVNTTHPGSAWAYAVSSGSIWKWSQPLTRTTVPQTFFTPQTELTSWANGDTANLCVPPTVDIVAAVPVLSDVAAGSNNSIYISNVLIPAGSTSSPYDGTAASQAVVFQETSAARNITVAPATGFTVWSNNYFPNGVVAGGFAAGTQSITSGVLGASLSPYTFGLTLDGDIILKGTVTQFGFSQLGLIFLDTSSVLKIYGTGLGISSGWLYSSTIIWGPGQLNVLGRAAYPSGAGKAAAIFTVSSLKIDGLGVFCIGNPAASTTTFTCNQTLTAAGLDTALGASVTGCAYVPGGGAFCNTAQ